MAATVGVAAFLGTQLLAWPPHEDETLALFVGSQPLGEMLQTVLWERGGAPLHFLLVHLVSLVSPTLAGVRAISLAFAVLSIPVVALLARRLTDRRTALIATILVAASWVTLFHGVYGRMYSLFLFLSALSFVALLRALERRSWAAWTLWALAMLATLASHQYGAFLLAVHVVYTLVVWWKARFRLVLPGVALLAVVGLATPVWRSNLTLASRFDVGLGDGGSQLGGPYPVLEYLRSALGDFVAGWVGVFAAVCAVAVLGLVVLARTQKLTAMLAGLVFLVPTIGLMAARVGGSASAPETRHLVFALPFFAILVAAGVLFLAAHAGRHAATVTALAVATLVALEVAWGWSATPTLYAGEPTKRREAREEATRWLAQQLLPSDVLFGYDPLYLGARQLGAPEGQVVVPRADPTLAAEALTAAHKPLGRGVWVLDASDGSRIVNNASRRLTIQQRAPDAGFEAAAFGPFLILVTKEPVVTAERFLRDTVQVQAMGAIDLGVTNAYINYNTAVTALAELEEAEMYRSAGRLARPPLRALR